MEHSSNFIDHDVHRAQLLTDLLFGGVVAKQHDLELDVLDLHGDQLLDLLDKGSRLLASRERVGTVVQLVFNGLLYQSGGIGEPRVRAGGSLANYRDYLLDKTVLLCLPLLLGELYFSFLENQLAYRLFVGRPEALQQFFRGGNLSLHHVVEDGICLQDLLDVLFYSRAEGPDFVHVARDLEVEVFDIVGHGDHVRQPLLRLWLVNLPSHK